MGVIYLVSVEESVGKTALAAGLVKSLQKSGKSIGYLKPQADAPEGADDDTSFIKSLLTDAAIGKETGQHGKDIVLVEASIGRTPGEALSQRTYGAAREMRAKVIAIEAYSGHESPYVETYRGFGKYLAGVVINKVPEKLPAKMSERLETSFSGEGIRLLGLIPENRRLMAVTVGELAEKLNGTIVNNENKSAELVENFMMGALVVGSGLDYFNRMSHKAAIMRMDRTDMQLAALETPTTCLVLGGGGDKPVYNVIQKAKQKKVPIITTGYGIGDIAGILDNIVLQSRFRQEAKVHCMTGMVEQNLDIQSLAAG